MGGYPLEAPKWPLERDWTLGRVLTQELSLDAWNRQDLGVGFDPIARPDSQRFLGRKGYPPARGFSPAGGL